MIIMAILTQYIYIYTYIYIFFGIYVLVSWVSQQREASHMIGHDLSLYNNCGLEMLPFSPLAGFPTIFKLAPIEWHMFVLGPGASLRIISTICA